MNLKWKQLALAIVATLWMATGVAAEDFSVKPVRLLVGFSPEARPTSSRRLRLGNDAERRRDLARQHQD